jgi:hypothetical protein
VSSRCYASIRASNASIMPASPECSSALALRRNVLRQFGIYPAAQLGRVLLVHRDVRHAGDRVTLHLDAVCLPPLSQVPWSGVTASVARLKSPRPIGIGAGNRYWASPGIAGPIRLATYVLRQQLALVGRRGR